MLLFQSEGDVDRWCEEQGCERGAVVPVSQLQQLAQAWYGDRLDPGWRPRTREESQALLESAGLNGEFWRLD
jgi:hypothetical protein